MKHYQQENNTLSPYFHTKTQFKLFQGEFVDRPIAQLGLFRGVSFDSAASLDVQGHGLVEGDGIQA